ncbi:uncharacterized protein VTP21DRAFT_6541 [Calcarisporiella thermophila]|uniref:uncharacterized protein n=1 Tax=Calcarisporiella thermophila TaxID=911321 RepID=UPI00374441D4
MSSYYIRVIQQPTSGYAIRNNDSAAEEYRLNPPLVVQCFLNSYGQEEADDLLVAYVYIYTEDGTQRYDSVYVDGYYKNLLMGTLVSSPTRRRDSYNRRGVFFTFSDLCVRLSGRYRLAIFIQHMGHAMGSGYATAVASGFTEPFNIYDANLASPAPSYISSP